jgi:hypothetical protein
MLFPTIYQLSFYMGCFYVDFVGKQRASMPITPFLSEEKRAACLEALRLYASGGPQEPTDVTYPIHKELDDIYGPPVVMTILEDPDGPKFPLVPVNLAAVQRYRKLVSFGCSPNVST